MTSNDYRPKSIAKFGGTSVADHTSMVLCAKIVKADTAIRVVVVSASAGVTNALVRLAHDPIDDAQREEEIQAITRIEYQIRDALTDASAVDSKLKELLSDLRYLAFHEELRHRPALKDALLSIGERMSSLLFAQVLTEQAVSAINFDARRVMRTDDTFGQAIPQLDAIAELGKHELLPLLSNHVAVTQGFIGADEQGNTTTLGRGGSDYTAALLAEALGASICQIWTDVVGVYTTDPRITDKAKPLPELSFEEAAEMATFGAKVLHPATMEPALRQDIKVFVGSSREPERGGTWIVRDCEDEPAYRAITRRREQVMVTVKTPKMLHAQGFLQQVFAIMAKHGLSIDLVTTSEIAVSFTLDNPANSVTERLNRETIAELQTLCEVLVEDGYDLVTVVGNNMHSAAGISSNIFAAVADYNLRMICYGANPHNLSFLVNQACSADVVRSLHTRLFE